MKELQDILLKETHRYLAISNELHWGVQDTIKKQYMDMTSADKETCEGYAQKVLELESKILLTIYPYNINGYGGIILLTEGQLHGLKILMVDLLPHITFSLEDDMPGIIEHITTNAKKAGYHCIEFMVPYKYTEWYMRHFKASVATSTQKTFGINVTLPKNEVTSMIQNPIFFKKLL